MKDEPTEIPGTRVAACGSTRCVHNLNLQCTAEKIVVSAAGDCRSEKWVEKFNG